MIWVERFFLRKPLIAEGIGCDAVFWIKKEIA